MTLITERQYTEGKIIETPRGEVTLRDSPIDILVAMTDRIEESRDTILRNLRGGAAPTINLGYT